MQGTSAKIDPLVERSFLAAIERRNLPLEEIVCVHVCDTNVELFGGPGSDIRRELQYYFKNLKRRSIRSYVQLLDRFAVRHGEATARLLALEGRIPSPVSEEASNGGEQLLADEPSAEPDRDDEQILVDAFTQQFTLQEPPAVPSPQRNATPQPALQSSSPIRPSPPPHTNSQFRCLATDGLH